LRERGGDIQLLLDRFRQIYCTPQHSFTLHDKAMELLESYGYPGNVRELRNIVIRLSAKYPGQRVSRAELDAELETGVITRQIDEGDADAAAEQQLRAPGFRLDESLDAYERRYIQAALRLGDGNLSQAARLLGINRTTLYSRMQRLGLDESH
jgi:DNA-binding NtrC family response regulator